MRNFLVGLALVSVAAAQLAVAPVAQAAPGPVTAAPDPGGPTFTAAGGYHPLALTRILDTRNGIGGTRSLAPSATAVVRAAGFGAIPASGVGSIAVNITVLNPGRSGSLSIWPSGTSWDASGTVSFSAGFTAQDQIVANLGADGRLQVRNNVGVPVDIVADVSGYFESGTPAPGGYLALKRTRVLDTRVRKLAGSATLTFAVANTGSVPPPAPNQTAAVNVTVLNPAVAGSLSMYDGSKVWNRAAEVTFGRGVTEQGEIYRALAPDGTLTIRNNASVPLDVVVDVFGEFTGCAQAAGMYCGANDYRVADSRSSSGGPVEPQSDFSLPIGTDSGRLPWAGVAARVLTIMVPSPATAGSISIWTGPTRSAASAITYRPGVTLQRTMIVPVGPDGIIWIHNFGAAELWITVDVTGYLGNHDVSLTESSVGSVDPDLSPANAISCADPGDCLAVNARGQYLAEHGGRWGLLAQSPLSSSTGSDPTVGVSCPEPDWCLIGGGTASSVFDGSSFAAPLSVPFASALQSLSCFSRGYCVAVSSAGQQVSVFDGQSWSVPVAVSLPVLGISCVAVADCYSRSLDGTTIEHFDGASWAPVPTGLHTVYRVSCGSASLCIAVGAGGVLVRFDGNSWSEPQVALPQTPFWLSCSGSAFCFAGKPGGPANRFDGNRWIATANPPATQGVLTCLATLDCVELSGVSWAETDYDGSNWSLIGGHDAPRMNVTALGCSPGGYCVIGDGSGRVAGGTATSYSLFTRISDWPITAIACGGSGGCLAADANGSVFTGTGGHWSSAVAADPGHRAVDISCAADGALCAMVTSDGRASTFDGSTWAAPRTLGPAGQAVSCPTVSLCVVLLTDGRVVDYTSTGWQNPQATGVGGGADLSCASPTYCMITGQDDNALLDGTSWRRLDSVGAEGNSVECPAVRRCFVTNPRAIDTPGGAYLPTPGLVDWNGSDWSYPTPLTIRWGDLTARPTQLSCPTVTLCVAVSDSYLSLLTPPR